MRTVLLPTQDRSLRRCFLVAMRLSPARLAAARERQDRVAEGARCQSAAAQHAPRRSSMKVKGAMHRGVDWVSPDTPVTELAKLMREHDIGAIPIGENDRLIGMVTDRDIVCKGLVLDNFDAGRATARDVMTPGIHCCRDE